MESLLSSLAVEQAGEIALRIAAALAVIAAGFWLSGRAERLAVRLSDRAASIDATLAAFFAGLARVAVMLVAFIEALELLGVGTVYIALFGAAGLALVLAMRGTVNNFAAGVMLLVLRPFKVGDFIEAGGASGTVMAMTPFATELATPDNVKAVIPNGAVLGGIVKNYTAYGTRRIELRFAIGYDDDIDKAMNAVESILRAESRVRDRPEPVIAVGALGERAVHMVVQAWCGAADHDALRSDLIKAVKEAFDREGIGRSGARRLVRRVGAESGEAA